MAGTRKVTEKKSTRFIEYVGGGFAGVPEDPDPDSRDWRPLTKHKFRDLSPLTQERQIDIAHWLYLSNPVAFRTIEITKDFVIGEGICIAYLPFSKVKALPLTTYR